MEEGKVILGTNEYQDLVHKASCMGYIMERFERTVCDNQALHNRLFEIENKVFELVNNKK
ncbi:hypothetical protein [Cellulosilyticum sp. I15G10I2]|uniref:hypothetical protein n=1 Tax=Cellulosilyticum sp. I15G10I2 TaxID=1892843 RepID=UPI00085CDC9A|nr:hypothetical protein [Cellulosilyticum sp. I15G10I2]